MKKRQKDYDWLYTSFWRATVSGYNFICGSIYCDDASRKNSSLILYGKKYLDAVYPLSILIWSTGFAIIGTARGIWIVAEGYNKYTK